jgi:hypothetical protein
MVDTPEQQRIRAAIERTRTEVDRLAAVTMNDAMRSFIAETTRDLDEAALALDGQRFRNAALNYQIAVMHLGFATTRLLNAKDAIDTFGPDVLAAD